MKREVAGRGKAVKMKRKVEESKAVERKWKVRQWSHRIGRVGRQFVLLDWRHGGVLYWSARMQFTFYEWAGAPSNKLYLVLEDLRSEYRVMPYLLS